MQLLSNIKSNFFTDNKLLLCILITLFIVKGVFYAAFVIPLTMSTSPDDVGHFSYIQYISSQRRLPIHGQTPVEHNTSIAGAAYWHHGEVIDFHIDEEIFLDGDGRNWIVQHPPLYYILMSVIYSIASLFTRQFSHMILILRLANMLFGVASIVFIGKILDLLQTKDVVRKCILIFFVFSAPLQFFFSTITNDSMLIFVCIFALYYLLKYVNSNRLKDFIIFVVGSALIFATKYNGFMVMFTYVGFFLYHSLKHNGLKETTKLSLIGIPIGLAIILPDLLFNYFAAGGAITNDGGLLTGAGAQPNHPYSFAHFLFRRNYVHNIVRHIILLIGWADFIPADSFITLVFAGLFIILTAIHCYKCKYRIISCLIVIFGVFAFVVLQFFVVQNQFTFQPDSSGFASILSLIVSCMLMLLCFTILATRELSPTERDIHWLFIGTLIVVVAVYIYTHFGLLQLHGMLRALHGRYYYIAVFPFAYLLFNQLGEVKSKVVRFAPLILTLVLTVVEFHVISMAFYRW